MGCLTGPDHSALITIEKVSLVYGGGRRSVDALRDINFSVGRGEFVSLVGPSGCGKSTILHVIAGFIAPQSGTVRIAGAPIERPGTDRGVVFQRHNLFPWKTVRENIALGLKLRNVAAATQRRTADDWIARIGLQGFEDSFPDELSEGMRQRVGLARAFVTDPTVLLMDEPFASLDALTAIRMRELLVAMWEQSAKTVLFVTHDIDEAILLSDRIIVFTERPAQVRTELRIDLARPRSYERSLGGDAEPYRTHLRSLLLTKA
jgi:NitT/TauT family transport system ATP-binding protein